MTWLPRREPGRRGRLKLYVGMKPSWEMLAQEARELRARGIDLVMANAPDGIEQLPRRRVEFRGLHVEEMDLDAVLARQAEVVVLDDVAHANLPGSRNRKRYQDVLDLLDAGIHVVAGIAIDHIESRRGREVRETVPDSFLRQASELVALDPTAEELARERPRGARWPR
jgi:two-component system, OmpR family, sensor histidine kinase KdpD